LLVNETGIRSFGAIRTWRLYWPFLLSTDLRGCPALCAIAETHSAHPAAHLLDMTAAEITVVYLRSRAAHYRELPRFANPRDLARYRDLGRLLDEEADALGARTRGLGEITGQTLDGWITERVRASRPTEALLFRLCMTGDDGLANRRSSQ